MNPKVLPKTHAGRGDLQNWKRIPDESNKSHCNSTFESTLQQKRAFQEIIEKKNGMIERILIKIRGIPPNVTENLQCALMGGAPLLSVTWSL